MKRIPVFLLAVVTLFACNVKSVQHESKGKKPNILFIAIDDLRPELGCYGSPIAITPNIDQLAEQGLLFENAYCQQAICSPSRASLMTGARPESIGVIENYTDFRDVNPDIVTLPQQFIKFGYEAVCLGKVFHGKYNDPDFSWSRLPLKPSIKRLPTKGGFALKENQEFWKRDRDKMVAKYGPDATKNGLAQGPAFECADVPDETYEDGYNTVAAIATLKDMLAKNPEKPFFLGFGIKKPHLNFVAPKRYWDLYDREDISLSSYTEAPINGAAMGLHPSFEMRARAGIPKFGSISDSLARVLKHGYLACVSYADAQVGKVMQALEEAGVRDNTIVILWGDHGWHLGEMGVWGKATNYEIATRVPMIISAPNMPDEIRGVKTGALVELVDMYPTLCELAGVDKPSHLEGQSFAPLLTNPTHDWKKAVFSQFPTPALREWAANPLSKGMRETYFGPLINQVEDRIIVQQGSRWNRNLFENRLMGYGMRTKKYRLIVWKDYTDASAEPIFIELFDHMNDPSETKNIAEENPQVVRTLLQQFNEGWKGNMAEIK
ncbi:sulfatase [Saccharicrinis fermentans]|nr:sulfatase [Saccharicrinis fermentans]